MKSGLTTPGITEQECNPDLIQCNTPLELPPPLADRPVDFREFIDITSPPNEEKPDMLVEMRSMQMQLCD